MYISNERINQLITKKEVYDKSGLILRIKKKVESVLERDAELHSAFIESPWCVKSKKRLKKEELNSLKWCWNYLNSIGKNENIDHVHISTVNNEIHYVSRVSDAWSPNGKSLYRCGTVRISNCKYLPPSSGKVYNLMDNALKRINDSSLNPVERAIYAHLMIGKIHPFEDGNGRTARLVQNFILSRNYFLPISIPLNEREDYLNLIEKACIGIDEDNHKDVAPFFEYFADKVEKSLERVLKELRD